MVTARHDRRPKTYDDYLALPEGVKAELLDGELYMSPAPKGRHVRVNSIAAAQLITRFGLSSTTTADGPGGWWILYEPECHLALDKRVVIPDIAGWRRERMPSPPADSHKFLVVPDWVCEVKSPSTASRDALIKMPRYLEAGVEWLWMVDPVDRRVDVFRGGGPEWVEVTGVEGAVRARVPPFDEVELDLAPWWSEPGPPRSGSWGLALDKGGA